MAIRVNDVLIPIEDIHREMQNHPAASREAAELEAARALLIRQILLQEAARVGLRQDAPEDRIPAAEEKAIADLLETAVRVDEPDDAACRERFESMRGKLTSPALFEASHILFLAPEGDETLRARAREAARDTLARLAEDPDSFEALARARSDCSSAGNGGSLGQLRPGDTVPEFEAALETLAPGEILPTPLETRFGFHVIRLDEYAPGRPLPYEAARELVRDYLREERWRARFHEYVCEVAAGMDITGFDLDKGCFVENS
jgi:peptidyl-prolyl cis-trans isomerase C